MSREPTAVCGLRVMARPASAVLGVTLGLGACGDALLPSDYQGPPAAEIAANVLTGETGSARDALHPRVSVTWLAAMDGNGSALITQDAAFRRSRTLASDWDIGLQTPGIDMHVELAVDTRPVRLAVGKVAYFDDLVQDGRLDWSCSTTRCDRIKALSTEFVVYLDQPLVCDGDEGRPTKTRVAAGYHYYRSEDGRVRELTDGAGLTFQVADRIPSESDPTRDLRAFAAALVRTWGLQLVTGCR